jgi:diguanylate cyclase (GGDEF)-like protein
MRLTYKFKLISILSGILLASFLLLTFLNYNSAARSMREELVTSSLPLTRENIYSEIRKDLIPAINIASYMANDSFVIEWILSGEEDQQKIIRYLGDIHDEYGFFSTFFISDSSLNYYHHTGVLKQISRNNSHDVWYFNFKDSEKVYELDVDTDEASENALTIFVNYVVMDDSGRILGVTGVGVKMESFSYFLRETQDKYDRHIYLVDRDGLIQAHSDRAMIESVSIYDQPGIGLIAEDLLIAGDEAIDNTYTFKEGKVLVTARFLKELGWFLIVEQDEQGALISARRDVVRTFLIGLIISIIIITISGFTVNFFQEKIVRIAQTDELTQIPNRREFENQFQKSVYRSRRYGSPFALVLIDIDYFKQINDTAGHIAGDRVLKKITELIQSHIRPTDIAARWGGDEFIILTESDREQAFFAADRIRQAVQDEDFSGVLEPGTPVSVSCGIAEYSEGESIESITGKADVALYKSKEKGRNSVT